MVYKSLKYRSFPLDKLFLIMYYVYIINLINTKFEKVMKDYFLNPKDPMQRRYEALRTSYVEELTSKEVAKRFGYSIHTINALRRDFKNKTLLPFFRVLKRGPKEHRSQTFLLKKRIIELRKKNYSIEEIEEALIREGSSVSSKTIYLILKDEGFARLFRRTHAERRQSLSEGKLASPIANIKEFATQAHFKTSFSGVFLFIPLILDLGLDRLFDASGFYGSSQIPTINYLLSYLALKLIGKERLYHVNDLAFDYGLGVFAGVNVLPKATSITQYSYRHSHTKITTLLKKFCSILYSEGYIKGQHINLDFHTIPHWGEESQLEGHWVPTRRRRMKSVLTFFAQDLDTTYLCYSSSDLSGKEATDEILNFVSFYKKANKLLPECLVFDSKLTTYKNLARLNELGIKFITIKRRGKKILEEISKIKTWKNIRLQKGSRKHRSLKIHERFTSLKDYNGQVREIIVTGHGRELPMLTITNDFDLKAKKIISTYAHRWLIENNIAENVDFFNLNALASPVVVKVDFDVAMTLIANTLYKILSSKFKLFKNSRPKTTYRAFVEGRAEGEITDDEVRVEFKKRSFNPMLMDWVSSLGKISVPWMKNRNLSLHFEK